MSSTASRKETERTKLIQEKCQALLTQMLRDEDNKYCVDCDAKGPRWASWNLGVFLCIRCAGIHRNLGVHISRVKSVNLDTWTPEQVISLQQMGNSRARAVYEAQLPDGFRRPQTDSSLEPFIRAKYEHKKYLAREWVPPSPPKVDWAKEIDEELERQKRKKKASQACSSLGLSSVMSGAGGDKKTTMSSAKSAPLPAPLPKPKPGQSGSSPKTQRIIAGSTGGDCNQQSNDLLGLSSPTKPVQRSVGISGGVGGSSGAIAAHDLQNDSFSGFLSATAAVTAPQGVDTNKAETNANGQGSVQNSLAKDEEDFFNQGSLAGAAGDKDKSGKLTKDSILALYGTAPTTNPHSAQMNFVGQPQQPMFAASTGAYSGFIGTGGIPHPQQFMTPPNSASMYNSPVMTAPTAFTTPGMHHMAGAAAAGGFNAQFPGTAAAAGPYPQPMTGPPTAGGFNAQFPGVTAAAGAYSQPMAGSATVGGFNAQFPGTTSAAGPYPQPLSGWASVFQPPPTATASSTANLNQQFGNLNIGNVWQ